MPTIESHSIGAGVRFGVPGSYVLQATFMVISTDNYAFALAGDSNSVEIRGYVSAAQTGVQLGTSISSVANSLTVTSLGSVYGTNTGVGLFGSSTLVNAGEIWGGTTGVYLNVGSATTTVTNSGRIVGQTFGLYVDGGTAGKVALTNTGTIQGNGASYAGWSEVDQITNRGVMTGGVVLAGGNDLFDNIGGQVTNGAIQGNDGNDLFRPGLGVETIDAGADFDTLDFRSGGGLRVSLADGSLNTGRAAGDTYTGIERILGSFTGNDALTGNGLGNTLDGFGGNDALLGGGGEDLLIGGAGADTLRGDDGHDTLLGGAGADTLRGGLGDDGFRFYKPSEGGDRIADFSNASGNNDVFLVNASGFGGGLLATTVLPAFQFRTRSDNLARDADDRFIFRTTDQTLWFDVDGNGAKAPVLIADLQTGAVVTAADIWLV